MVMFLFTRVYSEREIESLDDLSVMVSKLFSPISHGDVEALPLIKDHPFGKEESGVSKSRSKLQDYF